MLTKCVFYSFWSRKLLALVPPLLCMAISLWMGSSPSFIRHRWQVTTFGVVLGSHMGASDLVFAVLPATLYGRQQLGSIQASVYVTAQLSSAAGAAIFGFAKDAFGNFALICRLLLVLQLTLAVILWLYTECMRHHP